MSGGFLSARTAYTARHSCRVGAVLLVLGGLMGCRGNVPDYVWYPEVPTDPADAERAQRIEPGDKIRVVVQGQTEMSGEYVVSLDGTYVQPLAGVVAVAGLKLDAAAQGISERLRPFLKTPVVTVTLVELHPIHVNAIGEVARTGTYELPYNDNVMDVLAAAGGLSDFADKNAIYVLRDGRPAKRIRFRYSDLTAPKAAALRFVLKDGDTVLVE